MNAQLHIILQNPLGLAIGVFGISVMVLFFLVAKGMAQDDLVLQRMRNARVSRLGDRSSNSLLKNNEAKPEGLFKALIPENPIERTQIRLQLVQAGFDGPNCVRDFFLVRLLLAVIGPITVLSIYGLKSSVLLPPAMDIYLDDMSRLRVIQIIMVTIAAGFYGPGYWLKSRISARQSRIE
ncbi:MAG: hypothetical protein ACRCS3_10765, partial [Paracoccaceae bacterium]